MAGALGQLTEGQLSEDDTGLGILTEGQIYDEPENPEIVVAEMIDQIEARYLDLLLRELPPGVYSDSGETVSVGGVGVPKEIHKRSLQAKAHALSLLEQNGVTLAENVTAATADDEIEAWEEFVLGETHPSDPLEVRQDRLLFCLRLRGGLSIPYLKARLSKIVGYEPQITRKAAVGWEMASIGEVGGKGLLSVIDSSTGTVLSTGESVAYVYVVTLVNMEPQSVVDAVDRLLTKIEAARDQHEIVVDPSTTISWTLGTGAIGLTTNLSHPIVGG